MEKLTIPNPLRDLPPIEYDLRLLAAAEARVVDFKTVNTHNGQELMALFCRAAFSLAKVYSNLQLQLGFAHDRVSHRKAVMLIDEIPPRLKAKGLQDNQMSRQAFLDLDEEYRLSTRIQGEIEAASVYIEKQLKAVEGALSGIKKIYDAAAGTYRRPNPNLSVEIGGVPRLVEAAPEEEVPKVPKTNSKYGKPNYG